MLIGNTENSTERKKETWKYREIKLKIKGNEIETRRRPSHMSNDFPANSTTNII